MFLSCILYQLYIFSENTVEKVRKPIRPRIPLVTVSTSSPSSSETTTTTTTTATTIPLTEIPTVLPNTSVRLPHATDITTTNRGGQEDSDATTTLKTGPQERETHSPEPATTTAQQQLVVESTELAPMVVVDNLDTLSAPEISSHKAPPPPLATQPPVRRTITTLPPATVVTTTLGSVEVGGTTLSPAIREMVDEFTNGIHAAAPEKLSSTAIETIRKNFEQKKNIFEQFVSFGAQDKAFVPNSEVFTSDWSARADPLAADKSVDSKSLTEPSTSTATNTPISVTTLAAEVGRQGAAGSKFLQERNSEGGFKPMIKPLFSPLS